MERVMPSSVAPELEMLLEWLDYHRATLKLKCEGLDAAQLRRRAVPPSSLSLLGLVRHMAEVERSWFRRTLLGEDAPPFWYGPDNPDGDFQVDGADVDEAFMRWTDECENSRRIVRDASSLNLTGVRQPYGKPISLRWILNHMVEEYARHNGHADLLRELLDGSTGK